MKELKLLLQEIKDKLAQKEEEISKTGSISTNTSSLINNRRSDIASFENAIGQVTNDPFQKKIIINNFTKNAEEIKMRISEIM